MIPLADFLKTKRYPGRFIVIGKDGDSEVAMYGATGRSPSSLARRFVQKGNEIFMVAADEATVKQGNEELLTYPAVRIFENGVVVANGRQIAHITELVGNDAHVQLLEKLAEETYEPDDYNTPRITGCVIVDALAALHIARFESAGTERAAWPVPSISGQGAYIATYGGDDVKPTPSFSGEPVPVTIDFGSADNAVRAVFDALVPPEGKLDYRVGVVAVYKKTGEDPQVAIVNRI